MRQISWGPGSTSLGPAAQEFPGAPELLLLSPEAQEIPEDSELVLLSQAALEIPEILDKGFVDHTKLIRHVPPIQTHSFNAPAKLLGGALLS